VIDKINLCIPIIEVDTKIKRLYSIIYVVIVVTQLVRGT
jgi:hypothetical protein